MDETLTGAWRGLRAPQVFRAATRDDVARQGLRRILETVAHVLPVGRLSLALARDEGASPLHEIVHVEGTVAVSAPVRRCLPLDTSRGLRLGELQFECAAGAEWSAHEETLAIRGTQLVLDHLDLLAARLRADEETERLIFVEALAASLGETRSLEEAMDLVLSYVCDYAGWPYAEAWIPDDGGETLRRVRSCVRSNDLVAFDAASADLTFQSGTGIPGKAWAIREAFFEPDFRPCATYPRAHQANACGLTTGLAIPVRGTSDVLAVVCFYHRNVSQVSPELLRFVSVVIGQLSGPVARARADATLQATERGHRALFDSLADFVVTTDGRGRIAYCNDAFLRATEYRRIDVIGREFFPMFSSTPTADRWRVLRESTSGFMGPLELVLTSATGAVRRVRWQGVVLTNDDGSRTGMASFGTDVTETHRLRSANDMLAETIDRTMEAFIVVDANECVEWVNSRFATLVGVSRERIVGQDLGDLARRYPDRASFAELHARCREGVGVEVDEVRALPTGERAWIRTSFMPVRDDAGASLHFLCIQRDVTGEKARQTELQRLSSAVHASTEGVAVTDADGRFVVINAAFSFLHGFAHPSELVGGDWRSRLAPSVAPAYAMEMQRALVRRGEWAGDVAIVRRDGTEITARYALSVLQDGGVVIAAHDMTERISTEQALVRARDVAEAASLAQANFVTQVSHELRTPLNAVIGVSNIVLRRAAARLDDKDRDYLGRVHDSGKLLLTIIDQILTHAKAESGRMAIDRTTVDVGALVHDVARQAEGLRRPSGVALRLEVESPLPAALLDPWRLKQIVTNLVSNALKFTELGEVVIGLRRERDGGLRLSVADTGIGIPEERLGEIWQPFVQEESGTTRRFGGTGLGLPIVRSLSLLMGLQLDVSSARGVGSVFAVRIPPELIAADAELAERHEFAPWVLEGHHKIKIV